MQRGWLGATLRVLASFGPLILLWTVLAHAGIWPRLFFPSPSDVWASFVELMRKGILPLDIAVSLKRLAVGSLVGLSLGIVVGLLLGVSVRARQFFFPLVSFFQSIAEIGWLPLVVMWVGFGFTTIVIVIAYTVFFTVALNTMLGITMVPKNLVSSVETLGGRWYHIVFEVLLPGAIPSIVTGVRLGIGYGWRALIAAEMLVGLGGLGFMIFDARQFQKTDRIVLGMIVMGTLWLLTDRLILKPFESETIERWGMKVRQR